MKVTILNDKADEYRFQIKGGNGEIIVTSEGYTTETDAWRGFVGLVTNILKFVSKQMKGMDFGS